MQVHDISVFLAAEPYSHVRTGNMCLQNELHRKFRSHISGPYQLADFLSGARAPCASAILEVYLIGPAEAYGSPVGSKGRLLEFACCSKTRRRCIASSHSWLRQ